MNLANEQLLLISDRNDIAQAMEQFVFKTLGVNVVGKIHPLDDVADYLRRLNPSLVIAYLHNIGNAECAMLATLQATIMEANRNASPKILVIAGDATPESAQRAFQAGANGYLIAMPTREEILEALQSMMNNRPALDGKLLATQYGKALVRLFSE
jgi:DNA-binding NarL/FixJ family response regulator